MKKSVPLALPLIALILLIVPLMKAQTQNQKPQLSTLHQYFFGMQAQLPGNWPKVPVYSMRLHDTRTSWADINPSPGVYDWTVLDHWLAAIQSNNGGPLMYTFSQTPQWASSNPNDRSCSYAPGECDPPNDLNADGTGPNQHWRDFVTALAIHAAGDRKIRFWEMWNEPAMPNYWTGTAPQLVRMAKDAREIILSVDPNAKMLTSPDQYSSPFFKNAWKAYADAGGLNYADIIAVHGGVMKYPPTCGAFPEATDFLLMMNDFHPFLAHYGMDNKPIWDTEADWGPTGQDCFTDTDLQTAYLAQLYIFHRSEKLRRFFWYQYDSFAPLVDSNGELTKAGIGYQQVHDWMYGAAMPNKCSANGTIWTCAFVGSHGYNSEAIWNTAETCNGGHCQTMSYKVDPQFVQYRDLQGNTTPIVNNQVPIGAKPILVENKTR